MPETYDVTIAIPTRDAGPSFKRTLEAVRGQDTARSVEVLAADSQSSDSTLGLLSAHGARVLQVPRAPFDWGRVREILFQEARAPIVVNLSQDAVPARADWLEKLLAPLSDPEVGVSCGSSIPDSERSFRQFQWELNGYYYFTREIRKFTARYGKGVSFANAAVPRRVWERLHFDPQPTGEDFQFQMKLHGAGLHIVFPEDAPVLHHHNYTLPAVLKRSHNEGFALRRMGCPYSELDLLLDLVSPAKYLQWLREIKRGSLRSAAEWAYPFTRPWAVYAGSRFARRYLWY